MTAINTRYHKYIPAAIFFVFLAGMENIYGRYFPNFLGNIGHDFSQAHPALLEGALWFWNNSIFDVPWFTASFCGGQPFFADPQGIYYSPLQWLAFVLPPTRAAHIDLLLCCSLGYWSFYFLARRVFKLSVRASVLAGVLAMSNSFLPERFLVGEMGYQLFLLVGFVAHALLSNSAWRPFARLSIGNVFWAGLAIAIMLQGGLTTLMLPAGLGVLALALVAHLSGRGASLQIFFIRGLGALVFAITLCAAKVIAGVTFMSHFPRDAYALPGFSHAYEALVFPWLSLFFSSHTIWLWATPRLVNAQWAVLPHEWAYQFGVVYLLLLLSAFFISLYKNKNVFSCLSLKYFPYLLILCGIFLVPSALLFFDPAWNAMLKSIPLIKTTSFPFRWIIIFIPIGCWLGAAAWERLEKTGQEDNVYTLGLLIFCMAVLIEGSLRDFSYYISPEIQHYKPEWVDNAWLDANKGKFPVISELTEDESQPGWQGRNDSMVMGKSFIHCYNPAYGYRLETLPVGRMREDSVFADAEGFLNIKNPACLIWPEANSCSVLGEEYKVSDRATVEAFVTHKPIQFAVSPAQHIANIVTLSALSVSAFLFLVLCVEWLGILVWHVSPEKKFEDG